MFRSTTKHIDKSFRHFIFLCISLCLVSCNVDQQLEVSNSANFLSFDPSSTGVDFRNDLYYQKGKNIVDYLYYNNGGGVAIGDIDNDGLEDIYFTANQGQDKLYKNLGNLKFRDITTEAGILVDQNWSTGVTIEDVNNDGHLDIYVCKVNFGLDDIHNLLYLNNGDGTFTEQSQSVGLDFSGYSTQASFLDFDLDGDLDMYLLNHSIHSTSSYGSVDKRKEKHPIYGDRFFENKINEAEKSFLDITPQSGIHSSALGYGLGIISSDINGDGLTDIYIGNDFHENDYLYINQGDKTFKESIADYAAHTSQFTMGVDAADINQDGTVDIFTADMLPFDASILLRSAGDDTEQVSNIKDDLGFLKQYARNHMHINYKHAQFSEQAYITKTFASDWSWSVLLQDFDNSGTTDVFISNGIINRPNDLDYINFINTPSNRQKSGETDDQFNKRLIDQMPTLQLQNLLFAQEGPMQFTEVSKAGIGAPGYSNGTAYADLDQDGTLEIICNNVNAEASISSVGTSGNSISINLNDPSNSTTRGAKLSMHAGELIQYKEHIVTRGFQSSSTHLIHFGLGDINTVDSLRVVWPDKSSETFTDITANKQIEIVKGTGRKNIVSDSRQNESYSIKIIPVEHQENDYDDLQNESLMHRSYAKEGPAFVCDDFNGDGYADIYIGGSRANSAIYLEGKPDYNFQMKDIYAFTSDARYEDVGAVVMDFNKDGNKDIYVISGGNDNNQLDKSLQDRLYIGDGQGNFKRAPLSLPHMNGSVATSNDYDQDGYEDLFVGTSNIPGAFGVSPVSFVLKNKNGREIGISYKDKMGMISDANWIDLNGDGYDELLTIGEWTGLRGFEFDKDSSFTEMDITKLGIESEIGLYRSLGIGDINRDGIQDIVLGNIGQNTSWLDGGAVLHLGDFSQNTYLEPIIFKNYLGTNIPAASKDMLQSQIPAVKKNHVDYKSFSTVNNLGILLPGSADTEKTVQLDQVESCMYISKGDAYQKVDLPRISQLSVITDILFLPDLYGGSLLLCGNDNTSAHQNGYAYANAAHLLSEYNEETQSFDSQIRLNLPTGSAVKKAEKYGEHAVVLATNDGPLILIEFRDKE